MNRPPVYVSGPWEVDLARRELRMYGIPVAISGRAFSVIDILAQAAGNEVSKYDLIDRIWPDGTGTENTLQVHVSAVRKVLGPHRDLLQTVAGRGYRLRGLWTIATDADPGQTAGGLARRYGPSPGLPLSASDLIGRADSIRAIRDLLLHFRIVTLTGPGGIGKSRLALEVGRDVLPDFADGVWLVDLAAVSNPAFVTFTISSLLGLDLREHEAAPGSIARAIGGRTLLLVLDTCEHVVESIARITETLVQLCPNVSILATSREPLRCDGEHVYRVPSLDVPPPGPPVAADLLTYSAAALLVARVASLQYSFSPTDDNLLAIASVCRRLDGIPLAIEFAASRAATLGLQHVAARLDDALGMLTGGYRNAVPRHQTLRATLDWSYNLLLDHERVVLRRVAVFMNGFTLEAAQCVAATGRIDATTVLEAIGNVVLKSLLSIETGAGAAVYHMHDTTKAYLREKLTESEDLAATRHSHAAFYRQFLEGIRSHLLVRSAEAGRPTYREHLADVLAALEYCFSGHGDADIATALAAAAAPLLFRLSLLNECHHWTERAVAMLDDSHRGTVREMELQTALGLSLMLLGRTDTSEATFARGLAIAEAIGDRHYQVWFLVALHLARMIAGDVHGAMSYARACQAVAVALDDPSSIAVADWIVGASCHIAGDQSGAERHCRTALAPLPESTHTIILRFGFDVRFPALCALARCLWLRGWPDQAVRLAHDIVADAETTGHPVTLCFALAWTVYIFFWSGDLAVAERLIERLQRHAEQYALAPYGAVALGLRGELWVRRGDVGAGLRQLQAWSDTSHVNRFRVHDTAFGSAMTEALVACGRFPEALTAIDDMVAQTSRNGAAFCLPELLRVKGDVIAAMPDGDLRTAEDCYLQALETAGQQSAPAWELRTALSLTRLLIRQDRAPDALRMLLPLYQRFSEGLESFDLQAAKALLDRLAPPHSPGDTAGSQPLPRQTSRS